MARVFSWKVAPTKYSYLIKDSSTNSYIRSRVTDANTLRSMADTVDEWDEHTYETEFNAMRREVNNVYNNFHDSNWRKYYDATPVAGMDIVLLSGKDGFGADGSNITDILSEEDYQALQDAIETILSDYRDQIQQEVNEIRDAIASQVSADVMEALNRLSDTAAELAAMRSEMEENMESLRDALEAARAAMAAGNLTPEMVEEIMRQISYFDDWLSTSGTILTMKSDYDDAKGYMGTIASQEDIARGLFTLMCANINTLSGTVGTVQTTLDASVGLYEEFVTWYDENAESLSELKRAINGKESYIQDVINFIDGNNTNKVYQVICGVTASIVNSAEHQGPEGDLTRVYQEISAASARVLTEVDRLAGGSLTTIRTDLDGLSGQITTSLTKSDSAFTAVSDLRETWDSEIGILRTVSDMVIKEDEYGDPIFYYVGPDGDQKVRVYLIGYDNAGLPVYNTSKDGSGTEYTTNVLPDYMTTMLSYIQQASSAITVSVTSGDVISALRLTVTRDGESIIYGLADKVLLDSDVIAKSLTANAANIGGVHIGAGMISAQTGNNKWALSSDGTLEATNAKIKGGITATSLTLDSTAAQNTVKNIVTANSVNSTWVQNQGYATETYANNAAKNEAKTASGKVKTWITNQGYTTTGWVASQNFANSAIVRNLIENIDTGGGGDIVTVASSSTINGVTRHTINVGNKSYSWDTIDGDEYLLLSEGVGSGTIGGSGLKTIISKNGLLQANNAIIYGKIYASNGVFQGLVSAATIGSSVMYGGEIHGSSISVENSDGDERFSVTSDGKLTAYDATINGDITMNEGNQITMVNSNGDQKFVLSSAEIELTNLTNTYIVSPVSHRCACTSSYENIGYAGSASLEQPETVICTFYKRSSQVYLSRPIITLRTTFEQRSGGAGVTFKVYLRRNVSTLVASATLTATTGSVTLNLANHLNDSTNGTYTLSYSCSISTWSSAPSTSGEYFYSEVNATLSSNAAIIIKENDMTNAENCVKIGTNGMQVILNGGSQFTFGMFEGKPILHAELRNGNTVYAGIHLDSIAGVTYFPLGGTTYKTLT